ncbi:MAG: hypothetical protein N2050_09470 [Flavobacteriales bacterium]|nr:hypothetical protein [Flavobacteriales bacterium]
MRVFPVLEIACFSRRDAFVAQQAGAHRIEFCSGYASGGVSAPPTVVEEVCRGAGVPVVAMLRPRPGNFVYSEKEWAGMLRLLDQYLKAGVAGIAVGCLRPDGRLDVARMARLVATAAPVQVTLHRAFDLTPDPLATVQMACDLGIARILTAGRAAGALQGLPVLRQLVAHSQGRIEIMAGGGVRSGNLKQLLEKSGLCAVHSSARVKPRSGANRDEIRRMREILEAVCSQK